MTRRTNPLNARALDPAASVVIEAVAGSGKTWLLVSRIVRLLLAGVPPSEILAITFTRKAAQEMAARLREWLQMLATANDVELRAFLLDREVPGAGVDALMPRARSLYETLLTSQPSITITTFHSWFLQLLKRAPLEGGGAGNSTLSEETSSLVDDAWERFAASLQRDAGQPAARGLDYLFREYGLDSTRHLLTNFLNRRADWWAYTRGQSDAPGYALARIAATMPVAPDADVPAALFADAAFTADLAEYASHLAKNTETDREYAATLALAAQTAPAARLEAVGQVLLTGAGALRKRKPSAAQAKRLGAAAEARLLDLHAAIGARVVEAQQALAEQENYRFNASALCCGEALLAAYQRVKSERQVIDYSDIEWRAHELISSGDHAAYMHAKLDARYRHVLLDEFQDTNPLQWLTLSAWFTAAAEADARPVVFMVGDPKQSIYRFRRADARLFERATDHLETGFGAQRLPHHESRRCAPAVIDVVNRLFAAEADYDGFHPHTAHAASLPGRVEVLPVLAGEINENNGLQSATAQDGAPLRNPLQAPLAVEEDRRREREAAQLTGRLREIVGHWRIVDRQTGVERAVRHADVMLLTRRRTHLAVYERALRHAGMPYVTSRQGGLLDTLEAQDLVALLAFLVSPFADLQLAHALRSPVFACSDADLVALAAAGAEAGTWWERLTAVAESGAASAALSRAHRLLRIWIDRADRLPVHDQLDRIYFEADLPRRYAAAVPDAMRGAVLANLQAFMQRALDTDAGRYPSLPRFIHELADLRAAPAEEAPDEGIIGDAGDAIRIYTVHGAKGLEAPVVWILDAAAGQERNHGYDVIVDWPPDATAPRDFSVWSRKEVRSGRQREIADAEAALAARENLNLLYVAMTRAGQVLIVSGSEGRGREGSWHDKVRAAVVAASGAAPEETAAAVHGADFDAAAGRVQPAVAAAPVPPAPTVDGRLTRALPTGARRETATGEGVRYGTRFHRLMERLTQGAAPPRATLAREFGGSAREFDALWDAAQALLSNPALRRFFDPRQYRRASNEAACMTGSGDLRRIDRLVEFDDAVWVLDYKTGSADNADLAGSYRAQVEEYCRVLAAVNHGKPVRGLLVFADGGTLEVSVA